jgi:hypothetical protein
VDIARVVGLPVWGFLPRDYGLALSSANQGKPLFLDGHTRLAAAVRQRATGVSGAPAAAEAEAPAPPSRRQAGRLAGLF